MIEGWNKNSVSMKGNIACQQQFITGLRYEKDKNKNHLSRLLGNELYIERQSSKEVARITNQNPI